jgi:hypothetical protein
MSQYNTFRNGNQRLENPHPFGIVVSREGFWCYVETLQREFPKSSRQDCIEAASHFIFNYQVAHFLIDRAVASLEGAVDATHQASRSNFWQKFHQHYSHSPQGYSTLEESLCCAYAIRRAKPKQRPLVLRLVRLQPPGLQLQSDDGKKILLSNRKTQSHERAVDDLLTRYLQAHHRAQHRTVLGVHGLMLYAGSPRDTNGRLTVRSRTTGKTMKLRVYYCK